MDMVDFVRKKEKKEVLDCSGEKKFYSYFFFFFFYIQLRKSPSELFQAEIAEEEITTTAC